MPKIHTCEKYTDEIVLREAIYKNSVQALHRANEAVTKAIDDQRLYITEWQDACRMLRAARRARTEYLRSCIKESLNNPE